MDLKQILRVGNIMRLKDFLIAVPLNLLFGLGMVYLRNFKGSILLLCVTTLLNLSLWFGYFALLNETGDKNFVALWLIAILILFGILALFVITWISAKARDNRSKLGFKKSVLASLCSFAAYFGVSFVSPFQLGFIEPFNTPASSMSPTVAAGDYIFSTKVRNETKLDRGEVVIFNLPENNSITYIKRLVGLPGDEISVVEGILHINGKPIDRQVEATAQHDFGLSTRSATVYRETLPDGRSYLIQEFSDNDRMDNISPRKVPEGHYFFMGDNRDNSRDSRSGSVGFIPADNIYRKARVVYFSKVLDRIGLIIH